jgi:antitoxin HicB
MEIFQYAVLLTSVEEGGFIVTCHDLPQVVTQGEDLQSALMEASDAMDEAFAAYMQGGLAFPSPTATQKGEYLVSPSAEIMAKAALYVAMQESGVTKTELASRLGVNEKEVCHLLDPLHGSKLPNIAQAIGLLSRRLVIGIEPNTKISPTSEA